MLSAIGHFFVVVLFLFLFFVVVFLLFFGGFFLSLSLSRDIMGYGHWLFW